MALREAEDEFAREGQRNPYDEAIDRFKKAGAKLADLLPPKGTAPSEMTDAQRLAWEYNERNVTSTLNAMLGTIADRASEEAGEELTPKRVGNVRPSPVPPEAAAPAPAGEVAPEPAPEPPAPSAPGESPRQGSLMRELGARPKLTAKEDAPPRIEVAPIEGGEPKYSGDIILDLSESVGKPIKKAATGRFLGMYEPGQAKTSIKFQGDLDTTAHEISHALDDQFAIMGEWARPGARSPFDEELATFWWHGSAKKSGPRAKLQYKRAEGVAEYLRAWMLNPEAAEAQAPKFTDFIKGKVPGKVMAKLASFGTKVRQYAGLSAVDQMRSQIRMGPEPSRIAKALKEFHLERWRGVKNVATSIYHWGVNRFYNDIEPVFRAYREARVRRGKEAPGPWVDAELSMRRIRGDGLEWGNQFLKGPMDLAESVKAGSPRRAKGVGGIEWITETLDKSGTKPYNRDLHDLSVLLTSQKTVELAGSVYKELGGKIAEMDRRIALAEDAGDAKAVASLERRKARLEQQARFRVGRLTGAGAGLYSDVKVAEDAIHELAADPKRMDALREAAKRYRAFADASLKMLVDSGRITPERYDAIRAENQFYSNMQVVMDDILTPGVRGTGGKAMGTSRETIHQRHGSTRRKTDPILSMIDQGYKMYHEARRSMALNQFYEPFRTGRGMYEGKPIDLADLGAKARASDENTITNYHNGKAEYWTHPPDIYKALKKWGVDIRLPWVLTAPARVLRWCVIHFPGFAARNLTRDAVSRIIISNREHPLRNLLPQVDVEGFTAQDLYELSGASATGHYLQGPRQYYRMMQRSVRHLVKQNVIVAGAKEIGAAYMNLLEGSETFGRTREFKSTFAEGKKKGMNDLDAMAFAAGESRGLMDFAQMGSVMRWVNQVVPFSNAQIQGLVRTGASAKKHPGRFLARWGMYVLAPTLLEYAWNSTTNKKEWEALPAWQKDMFWNIKIGSYWLAIPKPFEMGVLASGVSRMIDQVSGNKDAFRGYLGSVAKSFLPVDESALLAGIAPSVIETAANYDFFRGKSIVPDWEKNLPVEYRQGTENASRLGKALSAVIPTDPRFLDHIISQQFGGLGGMALRASDVGKREPESLPMYVTGLIRMPPGLSSVPVDKLRGLMRTYRLGTNKALRPFQDALSDYFAAQGTSAKDAAARRLREIAEALLPAAEAMAEEAKVKLQWKKDHPGEQLPEAPEDRVDKMLKLPTSPSLKMPKGPYD